VQMNIIGNKTVDYLLQIKAIKLNTTNPFTWASGLKSPIYCDNRKTLSHKEVRSFLKQAFAEIIREKYPEAEQLAGVATGAIAIGALVADVMELPYVYIRSESKKHGLQNRIEGDFDANKKTVVIEDLVSTGKSSLAAVDALVEANGKVLGMVAIFSYQLPVATQNFEAKQCQLETLANYEILLNRAIETNYISKDELDTLQQWRKNPQEWATYL